MLARRPLLTGILFGLGSHMLIWLVSWFVANDGRSDAMLFIGPLLLLARMISFLCFNLGALDRASTWRQGLRFAIGALTVTVAMLLAEYLIVALSKAPILSYLDPHTNWFAGLAYIFLWLIMAVTVAIELLIALIQTLIRACRNRRNIPAPSSEPSIN